MRLVMINTSRTEQKASMLFWTMSCLVSLTHSSKNAPIGSPWTIPCRGFPPVPESSGSVILARLTNASSTDNTREDTTRSLQVVGKERVEGFSRYLSSFSYTKICKPPLVRREANRNNQVYVWTRPPCLNPVFCLSKDYITTHLFGYSQEIPHSPCVH